MQINSIQKNKTNTSFQRLDIRLDSKPSELIFDAVRNALLPRKNEVISDIIKQALEDDIFISEHNGGVNIRVGTQVNEFCHSSWETIIHPEQKDTAKSFGERIRSGISEAYHDIYSNTSGPHIF